MVVGVEIAVAEMEDAVVAAAREEVAENHHRPMLFNR
jgi:hypothetical protein